jgi:hypothetical protein
MARTLKFGPAPPRARPRWRRQPEAHWQRRGLKEAHGRGCGHRAETSWHGFDRLDARGSRPRPHPPPILEPEVIPMDAGEAHKINP